jgi:hypothetical protein
MQPQSLVLRLSELKHEIRRKPLLIPAYLLIESLGCHPVEDRQLRVEQHLSTPKNDDCASDVLDRNFRRGLRSNVRGCGIHRDAHSYDHLIICSPCVHGN